MTNYPACNPSTKKLIPVCESQCLLVDLEKAQCSVDLLQSNFPLLQNVINSFKCDDPRAYYNFPSQYMETNSTECFMLSKLHST